MSSGVTRPRGRLPARVYWVRRALVLATILALIFAFARLLGGGGADPGGAEAAPVAAESPSPTPTPARTPTRPVGPTPIQASSTAAAAPNTPKATRSAALAVPTGACAADEITAVAHPLEKVAGHKMRIEVQLTGVRPACTFVVSKKSLVVKITSGKDRIWSSQQCPKVMPKGTVVVRSSTPTPVRIVWNGRRSDEGCTKATSWALPGYYHVAASVVGSEPSDTQFKLVAPSRPTVTKTVTSKAKKKS